MKIKNFRLRNRGLYYFFPGWNTLPFFNHKSKSLKHSLVFPSNHSPNRLIPGPEERRNRGRILGILRKAAAPFGFLRMGTKKEKK